MARQFLNTHPQEKRGIPSCREACSRDILHTVSLAIQHCYLAVLHLTFARHTIQWLCVEECKSVKGAVGVVLDVETASKYVFILISMET